jgi:hypothetical protein
MDEEDEDGFNRQRVPRDVRAISRCLDRHQCSSTAALTGLQGEISKITSLMSSMQSNFD